MARWKGIINESFSIEEFENYCQQLEWFGWRPSFIVLHNTSIPSLADRVSGFSVSSIKNLEAYYKDEQNWSAGPHLFIDDKKIWVFTPLTLFGIHSPSWNSNP
jgi:hypothetical protein